MGSVCRSSGVLTASAIVSSDRALLTSIHATEVGGAAATVKVFDGTDNTGKEVARITLSANQTIEFDMHNVICSNGIYFEETTGAAAVSVEFA